MPNKRKYHGGRGLLNLAGHQTTAAIVAEIEDTSTWKAGHDGQGKEIKSKWQVTPYVTFQISDCTRVVSFDLGVSEEDEYENALHKVDCMLDSLKAFRKGLVTERKRYLARTKGLDETDED